MNPSRVRGGKAAILYPSGSFSNLKVRGRSSCLTSRRIISASKLPNPPRDHSHHVIRLTLQHQTRHLREPSQTLQPDPFQLSDRCPDGTGPGFSSWVSL